MYRLERWRKRFRRSSIGAFLSGRSRSESVATGHSLSSHGSDESGSVFGSGLGSATSGTGAGIGAGVGALSAWGRAGAVGLGLGAASDLKLGSIVPDGKAFRTTGVVDGGLAEVAKGEGWTRTRSPGKQRRGTMALLPAAAGAGAGAGTDAGADAGNGSISVIGNGFGLGVDGIDALHEDAGDHKSSGESQLRPVFAANGGLGDDGNSSEPVFLRGSVVMNRSDMMAERRKRDAAMRAKVAKAVAPGSWRPRLTWTVEEEEFILRPRKGIAAIYPCASITDVVYHNTDCF